MAIAFDAAATGVQTFGTGLTYSHTCTGTDRALFVMVAASQTVSSVTYGGVAMTLISGSGTGLVLAGLLNAASGANDIVITTAAPDPINAASASYTGVDQATGWENLAQATTGDASPSVSVTSATGNLVVGGTAWGDNPGVLSQTPVAPVTERAEEDGADSGNSAAIGDAPGAASVTFAWTRTGGGFFYAQRIAAVSVLPSSPPIGPLITQPDPTDGSGVATATVTSDAPLTVAGEMLLVTFTRGAVTLRTTCWPETP